MHAGGSNYVFESSKLRPDVIGSVGGLDMLVVGTSVKHDVAVRDRCSRIRVVID
jgi:hypothetical protein